MLHRVEGENLIAISQPAHAWVSGQLARHWGNKMFGSIEPFEEVCQAAALHDIGFLAWEDAPTLNRATGLPHAFLELPTRLHLEIWSAGIREMLCYGRYSALLVSMHFSWLCRQHPSMAADERRLEGKFLAEQEVLQTALVTLLRNDFHYERHSTDEIIERNRRLISLWDWLSLLLCMGFHDESIVEQAPSACGATQIMLRTLNQERTQIAVSPWPFRCGSLRIACEGRHLLKTYANETEMRNALRAASPAVLEIELVQNEHAG